MVGLVPQGGTSGPTAGDWTKATLVVAASPVKSEGGGLWSSTITITVLNKDGHPFAKAPVKVRKAGVTVKECEMDDEGRGTYTVTDLTPGKHIFDVSLPAGKPKSAEITIKLVTLFDLGDANLEKDKDTWSMVGTIQVKDGNDVPAKRHTVDIRMDNNPPITVDTDENGVAVYTFVGIEKGNHTFSATPTGSTTPTPRHKKFESDKPPKKVADMIPRAHGKDGSYIITCQVLTAEKDPVKDVLIQMAMDGAITILTKTDANGTTQHPVSFMAGQETQIALMVSGTDIVRRLLLY